MGGRLTAGLLVWRIDRHRGASPDGMADGRRRGKEKGRERVSSSSPLLLCLLSPPSLPLLERHFARDVTCMTIAMDAQWPCTVTASRRGGDSAMPPHTSNQGRLVTRVKRCMRLRPA